MAVLAQVEKKMHSFFSFSFLFFNFLDNFWITDQSSISSLGTPQRWVLQETGSRIHGKFKWSMSPRSKSGQLQRGDAGALFLYQVVTPGLGLLSPCSRLQNARCQLWGAVSSRSPQVSLAEATLLCWGFCCSCFWLCRRGKCLPWYSCLDFKTTS